MASVHDPDNHSKKLARQCHLLTEMEESVTGRKCGVHHPPTLTEEYRKDSLIIRKEPFDFPNNQLHFATFTLTACRAVRLV